MNNVIQFQKPTAPKKPNNSLARNIMIAAIVLLVLLKLPAFFAPEFFREHAVQILSKPIKIPGDYIVHDLSGGEQKLSDAMGDNKITVLAFWATWCGYCAKEFPHMDSAIPGLARIGVKVLPIARGDDTPDKVVEFFRRGNIKNVESKIATTAELHKLLGVNGYPTFIVVDEKGMAFAKFRPNWEASDVERLFDELAKNSSGTEKPL